MGRLSPTASPSESDEEEGAAAPNNLAAAEGLLGLAATAVGAWAGVGSDDDEKEEDVI